MRQLLHSISALYTVHDSDTPLRDAWLVIEDGRIAQIGRGAAPEGAFDAREDLSGCLVIPGLINLHHHYFQTLTRAIPAALRGHLIDWLGRMYPIWSGMTPDDLGTATEASIAQLLLTGATTSVDHSYLLPQGGAEHFAAEVAAAQASGARSILMRGSMTEMEADLETRLTPVLGDRAGGLVDDPDHVLGHMRASIERHHDTSHGATLSLGLAPTTTTYGDLEFMSRVAALSAETETPLHIHFHPRPDERELCDARGTTPLDVLDRVGWLTPRTFFAHATRLRPDEMARCGDAGVAVAHCPRMILRLGARTTPVHEMLAAGMKVGVGVDGGASNDSGSMLGEMRIAQLLHRLAGGEGEVPWQDWLSPARLLRMATRDSAEILGRGDIGHLAPGMCADLAAFRMDSVAYAGAPRDPLATLFLTGDDDRAALTMVGGEILVRDRTLVGRDEAALCRRTDAATNRLLDRAARLTGTDYDAFL